MHGERNERCWKSREEILAGPLPSDEAFVPEQIEDEPAAFDRRGFLKASGFSLFVAALAGCEKPDQTNALGLISQAGRTIPGKSKYFASVCGGCSAGCGVLIKSRDGRPIKLEGNPLHPLSRGGLCAAGQASVLGLYDSRRLKLTPSIGGKPATWTEIDKSLIERLEQIRISRKPVRFLTGTIISPTTQSLIDRFLKTFPDARHVVYDSLSSSAIADAHQRTHGQRLTPRFRFDQADVIVSFDADFLGTWIAPVQYTADYSRGREVDLKKPAMSHHVQFESRMSVTGSKADERIRVSPSELKAAIAGLAQQIAKRAGVTVPVNQPDGGIVMSDLADRLWKARGKCLIVCGLQNVGIQILINFTNNLLGNYGTTLDLARPSLQRQGDDRQLKGLLKEVQSGKVGALFVAGVNPAFELPLSTDFTKSVGTVVRFSVREDETSAWASRSGGYVCPVGHEMETWGDAEPVPGIVSINQPTLRPLGKTRSLIETLSTLMGKRKTDREIVREHWKAAVYSRRETRVSFDEFWDQAVHDGCVEVSYQAVRPRAFNALSVKPPPKAAEGGMALVLYPKLSLLDGRHAYNPWLQELPDPVSKVTWDNYACLSPDKAKELGASDGDVISIGAPGDVALTIPVLVQPGQHDDVVAIALGYGSSETKRFKGTGPEWIERRPTVGANGRVGTNAAAGLDLSGDVIRYGRAGVTLKKTGAQHTLATTQMYGYLTVPKHLALPGLERRENVRDTTLQAVQHGSEHASAHGNGEGLWPDDHNTTTGRRWGMVIDLGKCTGCSACVVACQAENNIPVVGKDEIRRGRDMQWMRVDRYYADRGDQGDVDVAYQPMMCHHCDNAPCETVCPVLATVHSEEGLNQQVYNRCVGTRYCANNCPYKVRRFNWFKYRHDDETENLVLNPDVTVRSRGVMEKCSFCVQRIQEAKIEARCQGRELVDGDVQTACQQSCPAQAISFGDANDVNAQVSKLRKGGRHYHVLEEVNTRPSVGYLELIRNRPTGDDGHV